MPKPKAASGNPRGAGRKVLPPHIRALCRDFTEESVATIVEVMRDAEQPGNTRVYAACALLDRGWPRKSGTGGGYYEDQYSEGAGGLVVTIRNIVEGKNEEVVYSRNHDTGALTPLIEHQSNGHDSNNTSKSTNERNDNGH